MAYITIFHVTILYCILFRIFALTTNVNETTATVYKCQQSEHEFNDKQRGPSTSREYFISSSDGDWKFRLKDPDSNSNLACNTKKTSLDVPALFTRDARGRILVTIESSLTSRAQLRINDEYYEPDEYCVQRFSPNSIIVEICQPNCKEVLCIAKCCSIGKSIAFTEDGPGCPSSPGSKSWSPTLYSNPHTKVPSSQDPRMHFVQRPPNCTNHNMWPLIDLKIGDEIIQEKQIWRLLSDGTISHLSSSRVWSKLIGVEYCIDGMIPDFHVNGNSSYSGHELDQALIICFDDDAEIVSYSHIYVPAMLIASVFLFLTAIVYGLLWDQHTVHGWTIFSFVMSMFCMYVFLAMAHIIGKTRTDTEESGSVLCTAVGILAHFFFLSSFCWLTFINVDLFWTFRVLRPDGTGKSKGIRRYALFMLCALIVPISVIGTGLVLNAKYPDIESEVIVPEYGVSSCFISRPARGPYLYYVIGSLLACNTVLVVATLVMVYRVKKSTVIAQVKPVERSRESLKLFAKLFIIMGATWIFEIISWLATFSIESGRIPVIWIVIDLINVFQAVAIFVIFVCKRKIWVQLQGKYPFIKKCALALSKSESGGRNQTSENRTRTAETLGRKQPNREQERRNYDLELNSQHNPSTATTTTGLSKVNEHEHEDTMSSSYL